MESNLMEQIIGKIAELPSEQQREALTLIEALEQRAKSATGSGPPRHLRLKGATAGAGPRLTLADLAEARKEMWGEYVEGER